MSRAWMPMYWGDYLADTHHFTRAEHGGYLLLIAYYWCNGGLPDDENEIRKIAKCSPLAWASFKLLMRKHFNSSWRHKRIDAELAKAIEKSSVNSANAMRRHHKVASDPQCNSQSHSQSVEKAKKLSLLPADWMPNGSGYRVAEGQGWSTDKINQEIDRFRDHAKANNRRQADWDAAWRNWITSPYQQQGNGHARPKKHPSERAAELAEQARRLESAQSAGRSDDSFGSHRGGGVNS